MSAADFPGRVLVVGSISFLSLLSGCATEIEGAREPPLDWIADTRSSACSALSGTYSAAGMPAPANAQVPPHVVWPVEGSLLSIIERGSNANPRKRPRLVAEIKPADVIPSISIDVDANNATRFAARNAQGEPERLRPQTWSCEKGILTTRVALGSAQAYSTVRLWKRGNDLIAEQTLGETRRARAPSALDQRPTTRFYFRFHSTTD